MAKNLLTGLHVRFYPLIPDCSLRIFWEEICYLLLDKLSGNGYN